MARVGRNELCPCGSGKKYKRCCALVAGRRHDLHALDNRLTEQVLEHIAARFPSLNPLEEYPVSLEEADQADLALAVQWVVHELRLEGRPAAQWYYDAHGADLAPRERAWLEAQRGASLSVWEVLHVDRGRGVRLRDRLIGEEREVEEVAASLSLAPHDFVLARVVESEGVSLFCGLHARPLPPRAGEAVVDAAREELGVEPGAFTRERLREEEVSTLLIVVWEEVIEEFIALPRPSLANTDGDPLLPTSDTFDFEPDARGEIVTRIAALADATPPEEEQDGATLIAFVRGGDVPTSTLIGTARVETARVVVETNSVRRADALRAPIEEACGSLVRHVSRAHPDPRALLQAGGGASAGAGATSLKGEEAQAILRQVKAAHYAGWADSPIPALGGETPRESAKGARRGELDLLLREMENAESRLPEGERFDVGVLRRELGV